MPGVLSDPTARYRATEAWVFDTVIAPAIVELRRALEADVVATLPAGAHVVEIGSGGGQLAVDLAARRPDVSITGVDLSPAQVARARTRARAVAERVRFVEGSALALPLSPASADAVVSIGSIKHWPDPAAGLREAVRVLRPGGLLVVVEVDRGCTLPDARRFVSRWRMPAGFRPLGLAMFRTFVAGASLDLDDARALAAPLPLAAVSIDRIPGAPGWMLRGSKVPGTGGSSQRDRSAL